MALMVSGVIYVALICQGNRASGDVLGYHLTERML